MRDERTIVVLEGDETGQELLEESLRVLEAEVIGVELEFPASISRWNGVAKPTTESCTRPPRRSGSTDSG